MTRWTRPVICIASEIVCLLLIQASYEATSQTADASKRHFLLSLKSQSTRPKSTREHSCRSPEMIGSHLFRIQRETSRFPSIAASRLRRWHLPLTTPCIRHPTPIHPTSVRGPFRAPVSGVVKCFSPEKGFGFVELSDGSGDAFLHGSVLAQSGINVVQPGEILEVRV